MTTLAQYVRAPERDSAYAQACEAAAEALVGRLVGSADVPADLLEAARLATGANLYARRATQSELGSYQNGLIQPAPARPALDPLTPARHMLAGHLGPGIA